jgi:hypothetical protein
MIMARATITITSTDLRYGTSTIREVRAHDTSNDNEHEYDNEHGYDNELRARYDTICKYEHDTIPSNTSTVSTMAQCKYGPSHHRSTRMSRAMNHEHDEPRVR